MKQKSTYHFFLKSIVCLMLVGQLWANVASHCTWFVDMDFDLIELCSCEDCESEEKNNKKEKDDKFHLDLFIPTIEGLKSTTNSLHAEIFLSIHHSEISTPPPESFLIIF